MVQHVVLGSCSVSTQADVQQLCCEGVVFWQNCSMHAEISRDSNVKLVMQDEQQDDAECIWNTMQQSGVGGSPQV